MWSRISLAEAVTIKLPNIGDVLLERSYRAKHINISVKPPSKVRVAVPVGVEFAKAQRIAEQRIDWIKKQLRKYSQSKAKQLLKKPDGNELIIVKKYLRDRVEYLAKRHGFQYNKLAFKSMMTRWGSCSPKNNISLNILMAQLSKDFQDYIILHELLHTRIKDHGKGFWLELNRLTGDAKRIQKELKEKYRFQNK
jgi:hypothetical protein